MMFYYKDIAGVYSISPDDKCGIYVWHDCCSRTKGFTQTLPDQT